jgi:hypothetical protein
MSECSSEKVAANLTRERALFATKVFCRLCAEHGIKTCSWEKSPAWNDYVEGKIDEAELSRTAAANIRDYSKIFEDYKVMPTSIEASHEDRRSHRARIANRIYRSVCTKSGLKHCFFKNFAIWSEFVNGMLDEYAFIEGAIFEVLDMKRNADAEKL